ncbi:S41 family peptidase [Alkaliphilus hydrothermalis]|uniref:C-terminal peptidase prc n=1 Tax=Alkaliphilus hydrothermalis TaxID=1482730 RepID=A0ABS2NQ15_9FIRM|nr:S41 family peptidase [Alkaliphilus hydrothermalis]MBM7615044.1 C-terminal peptidase prc [Alkaliphilus hydrothermalis]
MSEARKNKLNKDSLNMILPWIMVIVFSLIILVMLEIHEKDKIKYEKYDYFLQYFIENYYALDQNQIDLLDSKDDFWISAVFNQVNENEDEMIKKYNRVISKELVEKNEEYHKLFSSNVQSKGIGDKIVYIKFDKFVENTFKDIENVLKNTKISQNLIIDLSNNIGGSVETANKVINLFTEKGQTLYYIEKRGEMHPVIDTDEHNIVFEEIQVITSNKTASAAEIMAISLKSNLSNVKIYGEKTTGKGIEVSSRKYHDGSMIAFVTGKLYGPNKEDYHMKGFEPDIKININYDTNNYNRVTEQESIRILNEILELSKD